MTGSPWLSRSAGRRVARTLVLAASTLSGLAAGQGHARAAPPGVSTGDCEVFASGQLRSNEYIASYQGGCEGDKAQGKGKAEWRLRYAPQAAPVVWQGRFDQGVFLPEREVQGARRIDSTRALLDLGALTGPGGAAGQIWVESRVDGKLPAQACAPQSLQVSTSGALADDGVAKQWLTAAYARWLAVCGAPAVQAHSGRKLRVQLRAGTDWAPDSFGNLPGGVVQAVTPFVAQAKAADWQQLINRAAQQQASAQREQARATELQANAQRLQTFARSSGAKRFVTLDALRQNPFRFGDAVVLVDLRLAAARTPTEAIVTSSIGRSSCCGAGLLQGDIAQWDDTPRIAAVRVKGRSSEPDTDGALLLQLVDSRTCSARDCDDFLRTPDGRRLKEQEL